MPHPARIPSERTGSEKLYRLFTNEEKAPFQALLFVYAFSRIGWRMTVFLFSGGTLRASDR